mgnify:CR=1 FL=1
MDELCDSLRFKRAKVSEDSIVTPWNGISRQSALDLDAILADVDDRHVLVFDTETNGLRGTVLQFACIIATHAGDEQYVYDEYWYTDEALDARAFDVHKIDASLLRARGLMRSVEVENVVKLLQMARDRGCELVAHNAMFDVDALGRTANAHNVAMQLKRDDVTCTMRASRSVCGLTNRLGRSKNASNVELYTCLFGRAPEEQGVHDAKVDTRITLSSFVQGRFRGYW